LALIDERLADEAPADPQPDESHTAGGFDLSLKYMADWTAAQRTEAELKARALTEAATAVTRPVRSGISASRRYRAAGNQVPTGSDVDHTIDLQLGGTDTIENMHPLNSSVNRSLGAQIRRQTKDLPQGTTINRVTMRDP
jgi:filamentous hemagglutinin